MVYQRLNNKTKEVKEGRGNSELEYTREKSYDGNETRLAF